MNNLCPRLFSGEVLAEEKQCRQGFLNPPMRLIAQQVGLARSSFSCYQKRRYVRDSCLVALAELSKLFKHAS